jgi:cysteine desulfuration protein SufE
MTIQEIQNEIVEEFSMFDDWMQRYEYIIDLGKGLPLIDEQYKTEDNLIKGCQSKVWVHAEQQDDKIVFTADSDAILTKGIIAILIRAFSNQKATDILGANTDFIDEIGLKEHLSATRANGLVSMIKQIKMYALAFNAKMNNYGRI